MATQKFNPNELHKKTVPLFEEYFDICILDEALQCVKEAIDLALDKGFSCLEAVVMFLEYLLIKNVFTPRDLGTSCLLYDAM